MARTRIANVSDVQPGSGAIVAAGGRALALFNVDGSFYAIDNSCAHRGGPLGDGQLDGAIVTCPWHGYRYDVRTGVHQVNASFSIACYPVTVEGGAIYVDL
ncbi:MAG TPA: Rieske 2Fe-2S domain-containing protein [Methylomirabilota bacterium]|nr:Rieske 2Fe-2S domain-containing protein [Methylomirabilota bacterium]